jgi:hypothetical protein
MESLATQSVLRSLPIDAPQAGIVGKIVVQFQEQADCCSHLEAAGQGIHDYWRCELKAMEIPKLKLTLECIS